MTINLEMLPDTYAKVKKSVVAIVSRLSDQPYFPKIIGTGFIVREDGLIFTCDHVIKAIKSLPKTKEIPENEWSACVVIFHHVPDKGMIWFGMKILGVFEIGKFKPGKAYYGEDIPDVGVIKVDYKGLPNIELKSKLYIREGDTVAFSGFPMGEEVLLAPGWLHQISPTLQTGVVSSILPFPCEIPHAFLLDIMAKGGSSGSPVFDIETGEVLGMVYAGLKEIVHSKGKNASLVYLNSSTLTLAIPGHFMSSLLNIIDTIPEFKGIDFGEMKDFKIDIAEAIEKKEYKIQSPKEPILNKLKSKKKALEFNEK